MKRYVAAMATINPQMQNNWAMHAVIFDRDEGPIPHIHVYHDASHDKCAYVRLDTPEYSLHHDQKDPNLKNSPLSKKQLANLIKLLSSPWPKHFIQLADGTIRVATGYEYCVTTWIDAYGDKESDKFTYDEAGNLVMPDYSKLKTHN